MSKVYNYIIVALVLTVLANIIGLTTSVGWVAAQLGLLDNPENFTLSPLYIKIIAVISAGTVVGVAVSFFTKQSPESTLIIPIVLAILSMVEVFIGILAAINGLSVDSAYFGWAKYIVWAVFIPLIGGFIISVIEWWRGVG